MQFREWFCRIWVQLGGVFEWVTADIYELMDSRKYNQVHIYTLLPKQQEIIIWRISPVSTDFKKSSHDKNKKTGAVIANS